MPEVQRRMMFDMVSMELRAVEEMAQDDELLAKPTAVSGCIYSVHSGFVSFLQIVSIQNRVLRRIFHTF